MFVSHTNQFTYTMFKKLLITFLLFSSIKTFSQTAPEWEWTHVFSIPGNALSDLKYHNGYVYYVGTFSTETITFGNVTLTNSGRETKDMFILKYDDSGNQIWAKKIGGAQSDYVDRINVDNEGNIYIAGSFQSPTISFGSIDVTNDLSGSTGVSFFVAKLSANGEALWIKNAYSALSMRTIPSGLEIDSDGNVYVSSDFDHDIKFNNSLYSYYWGMFLVKYDSSGNFKWVRTAPGNSAGVVVDSNNQVYFSGTSSGGTQTFASLPLSNISSGFIAKISPSGTGVWITNFISNLQSKSSAITKDSSDNIIATGSYWGNLQVGGVSYPSLSNDAFVVKCSNTGSVLWASVIQGQSTEQATDIAVDAQDNIYATGFYQSRLLNTGGLTLDLDENDGVNIYYVKFDSSGSALWNKKINSVYYFSYPKIDSDAYGNIFTTAAISSGSYLGNLLAPQGGAFIGRLGDFTQSAGLDNNEVKSISIYPNPVKDILTVESKVGTIGSVIIYNTLGQQVHSENLHNIQGNITVDISRLQAGYYLVEVGSGSEKSVFKVLKN